MVGDDQRLITQEDTNSCRLPAGFDEEIRGFEGLRGKHNASNLSNNLSIPIYIHGSTSRALFIPLAGYRDGVDFTPRFLMLPLPHR